ncbi:MAG: hypothetical protein SFY32_03105 [Bacteroidota bacterium]|nr:hypothetical protein [Bacteroidota bacterium]
MKQILFKICLKTYMSNKKSVNFGATWQGSNTKVKAFINLGLFLYEEGGKSVAFCPALDLIGYGNTEEEAKSSFELILSEYLDYTTRKGTLRYDLEKHGWKLKKNKLKVISPPDISKLLVDNEEFAEVFNNKDFRKTHIEVNVPEMV